MKTLKIKAIISTSLILVAGVSASRAQVLTWDPAANGSGSGGIGTWNLNSTANWWNGTADVQWSDNSATGTNTALFTGTAGTVTLNTSLTASNLQFTTTGYTLSGSGTLNLGGGGIDASVLSSGTTTIGNVLSLPAEQQRWQVGSGATLAVNGALTRSPGASVDFTAPGITTSSSSLANDANGIIGGWATVNDLVGPAADWAANDGSGNIIAYAGYTAVSGNQTGAGASAQNWKNAGGTVALTANATINSLNQLNDFTVNSGVTLTLGDGGLLLSSVSRWMLGGSATTSFLTSGTSTGELFVHVPESDGNANNWTIWPIIKDNGATPLKLVKDGSGELKLGNLSTYTGGTIVNAGILASTAGAEYGQGNAPVGTITPFGLGTLTVNNGAKVDLGVNVGNANGEYDYPNAITLNGGTINDWDGYHHLKGNLTVGAVGGTLGSTYDGINVYPKGLFIDGLVTGTGNLTVQDSGIETVNSWDRSIVLFTSPGTAAQNTYSGTVTVNAWSSRSGSYLFLIGTNALANATINVIGDNTPGTDNFGAPALLFGSGTSANGPGIAQIGGLSGTGDFVLANTLVVGGGQSLGNPVALTVGNNNSSQTYSGIMSGAGSLTKIGTGTLTLSGANTYTGNTVISGGGLVLTGGSVNSANITVANGATLDVSGISFTLSGSQSLFGGGNINGSVGTSSGSKIYAGTDGGYGTNNFNNNLNLAAGALAYLDLGTLHNGANDRMTVAGTLTANNNIIHLKAPSTSASLEATDYVLISSANPISGTFAGAPSWDVQPVNAGNFSVVTSGNTVTLHYLASTAPKGGGSATPAIVTRNQNTLVSVTVTNGSGGTINSVVLDASSIGGSSSITLVSAGGNVYTNMVSAASGTAAGNYSLVVTLTDTVPLTGLVNIPLNVTIANDVWNGAAATDFFSGNLNWTNQAAPGLIGDSLEFAGTTRLTPSMDSNYTVTGITFDNGAGSFNIGTADSSVLTLSGSGSIVNNSANAQTLNVPIADTGGGLIKTGTGLVVLAGNNTFTGPVTVNAGALTVPATGTVAPNGYVTVGNTNLGKAVLNIAGGNLQANINPGQFSSSLIMGNVAGSVGDLRMSAGSLIVNQQFGLGNGAGGYGGFSMSGGTANIGSFAVVGFNHDSAVLNLSGGTFNINDNLMTIAAGGNAAVGVVNVSGGVLNSIATTGSPYNTTGGIFVGEWGNGTLNVFNSGSVQASGRALAFGLNGGANGTLNLLGGTVTTTSISQGSGNGAFNFNGGTLQAGGNSAAFMSGLTSATVYSGGALIDDGGYAITISQPLLAPTGYGVASVGLSSGGAGYVESPLVTISGGTGSGATATAMIDYTAGTVTNIFVTSPGNGYSASDTLTVTLTGGGGSGATASTPVLAANISGGLTKIDTGTLTLGGANTYLGSTVISNGTLALTGSLNSTNIYVTSGTIFDVSGISYTLGGSQSLSGSGNINGPVSTSAGSRIYAGTDGGFGTNTFNSDLTLASGTACYLDLGTAFNGVNDQIVVSGTLTANNNVIHLKAPSTSSTLDTADYVLITAGSIAGTAFASAPVWDVAPINAGHYSIVTGATTVTLHYSATATSPTVTASASPTSVLRNQSTRISATVTSGSASISTVTVDLSSIGGSTLTLVRSNSTSVYTNTVLISASVPAGNDSLTVTVTDTASQSGSASVPLTIATSTEVWNGGGGNANWGTNPNWVSGAAPGYAGDAVAFAGTVDLTPNLDNNYSVASVAFNSGAGSFNVGTANGSTLTLTGSGVVNNSASAQTLNVPVVLGGPATINAAAGDLSLPLSVDNGGNLLTASGAHSTTISAVITGNGGLTKTGNGALTLNAANTYAGLTTVSSGTLNVTGGQVPSPTAGSPGITVADTGHAVLNVSGGTVTGNTSSGEFSAGISIGAGSGAAGSLQLSGSGIVTSGRQIVLGNATGSYGAWTQTGGSATTDATTGGFLVVAGGGAYAAYNQSGGSFTIGRNAVTIAAGDANSIGVMNLSGGTLNSVATTGSYSTAGGMAVGEFGTGYLNVSGTALLTLSGNWGLTIGKASSAANGIVNLLGGTINTTQVVPGAGTSTFNFNGGTLQTSAANGSFMSGLTGAYVYGGGAVIDDGGNAITVSQPLLAPTGYGVVSIPVSSGGTGYIDTPIVTITNISATGSGATAVANVSGGAITSITVTCPGRGYGSGDTLGVSLIGGGGSGAVIGTPVLAANTGGGLTKLGSGTLTLSGVNTYTGNTTVSAGTLELVQPALATSSTVNIATSAILQLDFAGPNQVAALVLNGVNQAPGTYNSTTAAPYITGTGSLVVPSSIASNPTNITFTVSSGTLHLTWPGDHLGWILQSQTNNLNKGLGTNWFDVAGSAGGTSQNITINPALPTVFYRLRHP